MDWFTHIFTAVALAILLRSNRKVALAMAFGAMAPDLDTIFTPVTILFPQLWFLDHRTFSHSLLLGLPWALAVTWVFQRPAVLRLWRRIFRIDITLSFDRAIVLPLFAGVLLHILMDTLTVQGPSLFTPFSATRYQLNWFYFLDLAPLAVSSVLLILTLGSFGPAKLRRYGLAILLAALVATGGVRLFDRAMLAPGDQPNAVPTWDPSVWWTWQDLPNGSVEVSLLHGTSDPPLFTGIYPRLQVGGPPPPPGDLDRARRTAESTVDFTAFAMNTYTIALNASFDSSGTWRLGYSDPVRLAQAKYSGSENAFSPEDLVVRVAPDGSVSATWP